MTTVRRLSTSSYGTVRSRVLLQVVLIVTVILVLTLIDKVGDRRRRSNLVQLLTRLTRTTPCRWNLSALVGQQAYYVL